jgi:hypothetical protein
VYENATVPPVPVALTAVVGTVICGINNPKLPVATCPLSGADTNAPIVPTLPVPVKAVNDGEVDLDAKLLIEPDADTPVVFAEEKKIGVPERLTSENAESPNMVLSDVDQRSTGSVGRHDERERTSSHSL